MFSCHRLIKTGLGFGAGLGLMSFVSFVLLLVCNQLSLPIVVFGDGMVLAIVLALSRKIKTKNHQKNLCAALQQTPNQQTNSWLVKLLAVLLVIMVYIALLLFFLWSTALPHGAWDAWSIWNANARFIFRGGTLWKQALSSVLLGSSTDYPWMYPVVIGRLWLYAGTDTPLVPIIVSGLYTFGSALLLGASLLSLRGKQQALMAMLVLLATPFLLLHSASQMADIPLGYYFLATIVCWQLFLKYSDENETRFPIRSGMTSYLLFLTGFFAGLAMFMKNEGIFFIIMFSITYFSYHKFILRSRSNLKLYRFFLIGIAPFVSSNLLTRIIFTKLPTHAVTGISSPYLSRLFDLSRHEIAASAFWFVGKTFGQFTIPIWLLLCLYLLFAGVKLPRHIFYQTITILGQIFLMLLGYYAIYIFISPDIVWHIKSSLDRLYLQLWPTFLFFYFLLVGELKKTKQNDNKNDKNKNI